MPSKSKGRIDVPRDVWDKLRGERNFFHDMVKVMVARSMCEAEVPYKDVLGLKSHALEIRHEESLDKYHFKLKPPEEDCLLTEKLS